MKPPKPSKKLIKALTRLNKASEQGNEKLIADANESIKNENIKIRQGLHRARMIELGLYGLHKEKKIKSKKVYKRNDRHPRKEE